jgi:hypothetical protein
MKSTLEEVQTIVQWWISLRVDFDALNLILHNRQKLSGYLFNLGTDLAEARNAWALAKSLHEKEKNQLRVKFSAKVSATQADYQARANTASIYETEMKAEGLYFGMKHQYDAVIEVLEAMGQRIAVLRREWEMKNYAG